MKIDYSLPRPNSMRKKFWTKNKEAYIWSQLCHKLDNLGQVTFFFLLDLNYFVFEMRELYPRPSCINRLATEIKTLLLFQRDTA